MRVLVISHNVFDNLDAMGKTLSKFFEKWDPNDVAQIYTHPSNPQGYDFCGRYYRITDIDILKSFIPFKKVGLSYKTGDTYVAEAKDNNEAIKEVYESGRRGTPLIHILRDGIWRMGRWYTKELKAFIDDFKPEAIFLATGNYGFIYRLAYRISSEYNIPIVAYCCDDYYINNEHGENKLGKLAHKKFMKEVYRAFQNVKSIVTICEPMAKEYSEMFNIPCETIYTSSEPLDLEFNDNPKKIAYFGRLGLGRDKQLVELGKAVKRARKNNTNRFIDVYTSEWNRNFLEQLIPENGLVYHKAVSQKEMQEIYKDCVLVVHIESFDVGTRERIRYSISTKIPESLMQGPCLLAFGPSDVASIKYLKDNDCAFVITEDDDLDEGISRVLKEVETRERLLKNARKIAMKNHVLDNNAKKLKDLLQSVI